MAILHLIGMVVQPVPGSINTLAFQKIFEQGQLDVLQIGDRVCLQHLRYKVK